MTCLLHIPSDTKLLLTKNYFEKIIFEKLRISRVISGKSQSFPEMLRGQIPSKITKKYYQGIIFVTISCQRVNQDGPSSEAGLFLQPSKGQVAIADADPEDTNKSGSDRPNICPFVLVTTWWSRRPPICE